MNYPDHNIDPKDKNKSWLLQYAQKCWEDWKINSPSIFYNNALNYDIEKSYALGMQDLSRYKKPYTNEDGKSYMDLNRIRVRPIISKIRDIAISRIQQRDFNIVASPIDSQAKDDMEQYYSEIKVKIMMRDAIKKQNPELLDSPILMKQAGEPEDLEELEMQMGYNWKHNMAIEAEEIFQLIAYQNAYPEERRKTIINLYDHGVGGYKEYIDGGHVKLRSVDINNFVCSYCRRPDFKDATHMGEVIEVNISDLENEFSPEEITTIRQTARTDTTTNPRPLNVVTNNRVKVDVLDMECYSWDDFVFTMSVSTAGNLAYDRKDYADKVPGDTTKSVKRIYRFKWIIGTAFIYDAGLATNQKRGKSELQDTCFSYHLYAYNFYNMTATGFMKRLIPVLDEYQDTVIKIQHFKEKWIPYIVDVDMDALENVALGKDQKLMGPGELLEMMFQTNVLLSRRKEVSSGNINYKSVDVQPTPMAQEFSVLVADLARLLQELGDVSGFNALTDGTTPNAKTLVPVANMANDSTNNALFPVTYAEKNLLERMARGVIQREQILIKSGQGTQGVVHALGTNTLKFVKASPDLALHEFGIMIEDRPQEEQKMQLLQQMNIKDSQGLIDPEIWVMVKNCTNLKAAEQMLAFKIKKKREADQQNAMQMQQQNAQVQMQAAQAAEQAKQQTLSLEYKLKSDLEIQLKQMDIQMLKMKLDGAMKVSDNAGASKLIGQSMQNKHDENKTKMEQGMPVSPDNTEGMGDLSEMMNGGLQSDTVANGDQQPEMQPQGVAEE